MESLLRWAAELAVSDSPPPSIPPPPAAALCLGHALSIAHFPDAGGRGLAAARDLRQGEMVLRVPRSALMTSDSVMLGDKKIAACVARYPRLSATQILIACLLAELGKGRDSRWYPYLVELPRSYNTLANFSPFEVQALQVEDAIWLSEKAILKAKSDWKDAVFVMQEMELKPQLLTFRSWLWASATVSSRTLHIPWDSAGCLCPVGDLFNYAAPDEEFTSDESECMPESFQPNVSSFSKFEECSEELDCGQLDDYLVRLTDGGYVEDVASYCFYARRRYKKGEQVLLSYGTYTNLELLEHYGFLLNSNPNDKVYIQLSTDIYTSSSCSKDSLYIQPDGSPSFALLCTLRLWATPVNLRRTFGGQAYAGSMLSNKNELFVMKWVAEHCKNILRAMATSPEDDELLLVVIDKMLDDSSYPMYTGLLSLEREVSGFFQANGLQLQKESMSGSPLSPRVMRSLQRWKLAVEWRLSQKRTLVSSVYRCNKMVNLLSDTT